MKRSISFFLPPPKIVTAIWRQSWRSPTMMPFESRACVHFKLIISLGKMSSRASIFRSKHFFRLQPADISIMRHHLLKTLLKRDLGWIEGMKRHPPLSMRTVDALLCMDFLIERSSFVVMGG